MDVRDVSRRNDGRLWRRLGVAAIAISSLSLVTSASSQNAAVPYTANYNGRFTQGMGEIIVAKTESISVARGDTVNITTAAKAAAIGSVPVGMAVAAADGNKQIIAAGKGAVIGGSITAAGAGVVCIILSGGWCGLPILASAIAGGTSGAIFGLLQSGDQVNVQDGVPVGADNTLSGPGAKVVFQDPQNAVGVSVADRQGDFQGSPGVYFTGIFTGSDIPVNSARPYRILTSGQSDKFGTLYRFANSTFGGLAPAYYDIVNIDDMTLLRKNGSNRPVCPSGKTCAEYVRYIQGSTATSSSLLPAGTSLFMQFSPTYTTANSVPIVNIAPVVQVGLGTVDIANNPALAGRLDDPLSDAALARLANHIWKNMPVGSSGIPYSPTNPITPADVAASYNASGSPRPSVRDLYTPLAPQGQPIPQVVPGKPVTVNPSNGQPIVVPGSGSSTGTSTDNPTYTKEVAPSPTEQSGAVSAVMAPINTLWNAIPKPQLTLRQVQCPSLELDFRGSGMENIGLGYKISTDFHCWLAAQLEVAVGIFMTILAGIMAWKRTMSA